jgi:hypothetical protein
MSSGLLSAACDLGDMLKRESLPHFFLGGLAVLRWGEARFTADADVCVYTGFGNESPAITTLLKHFSPRIADAEAFAQSHRTLLVQHENGTALDIVLGGLPFEAQCLARASEFELLPNRFITTCDASDLVILKVFAGRGKDWLDIEGIVQRSAALLDWPHIMRELEPLLDLVSEPDRLHRLNQIRESAA